MNKKKYEIELTSNFVLSEFVNSRTARFFNINEQYHVDIDVVYNLYLLCYNILQPLRDIIGKITINSGYRCYRLNEKLNGAKNSQHVKGQAADIHVKDINRAVELIKKMEFDQLIIYNNFLHVSYNIECNRKQIIYKNK